MEPNTGAVTRAAEVGQLVEMCRKVRIKYITMVGRVGSGHLGGSLSATEMLVGLYFHGLRIDPERPLWDDRDRFVLSKGHNTPLYYTVLASKGYFPVEWLDRYDHIGSPLQGHPDMRKTPGVDMTTGSLGQGFSSALGMAIAARLAGKSFKVYALIGDGEFQEGQVWETIMYAGAHQLGNFVCIMDHNLLQLSCRVEDGLPIAPVVPKWQAFGWHTLEVDGHDMGEVLRVLDEAASWSKGPLAIISHTVKGKGVSFMENVVKWHSVAPSKEQVRQALEELKATEEEISEWRS
jgi:transketolase